MEVPAKTVPGTAANGVPARQSTEKSGTAHDTGTALGTAPRGRPQAQETEQRRSAAAGQDAGVDDLLDEIDGVLEHNAEEFVRGFVQKGGQ